MTGLCAYRIVAKWDIVQIGTFLFLDSKHIAETARLTRTIDQPRRFGPVVSNDRPWEDECVIVYGSVLPAPDGQRYQMWYQTYAVFESPQGRWKRAHFCYAESNDGVHWEKPELGLVEFEGSKTNNIFATGLGTINVAIDMADPREERRYKMLYSGHGKRGIAGMYVGFSPDGIHWEFPEDPVCTDASDRLTLLIDHDLDVPYVTFNRRHGAAQRYRSRIIYRAESHDFTHWTDPEPLLIPDLEDSPDVQFYGMPTFRYRDLYIGGLKRLWSSIDHIDTELVISRDTRNWNRTRQTFLPVGEKGAWDSSWVGLASSAPIERDGSLYLYHEGRPQSHGQHYPFPQGNIGLAVIPKDRFGGLETGSAEGFVVTKPFTCSGDIRVNVNAKISTGPAENWVRGGSAYAEVLDETGCVVLGFAYDDADRMEGDLKDHQTTWNGRSAGSLKGRTISLRIYLTNARLYAVSV